MFLLMQREDSNWTQTNETNHPGVVSSIISSKLSTLICLYSKKGIFATMKTHPSSEYAKRGHHHSSTEKTDTVCGVSPSPGLPTTLQSSVATRDILVKGKN